MTKAIFKTLREQSAIGFDGKISFQNSLSGQYAGTIFMSSGNVVGANFSNSNGRRALVNLLLEDFSNTDIFRHTVEPEVISSEGFQFELQVVELETQFREIYEKYEVTKKLKPPSNRRLMINDEIIFKGPKISSCEFDVLCLISDFGKVEDIYANSELAEFEVTSALVSLRKKGALKVLS